MAGGSELLQTGVLAGDFRFHRFTLKKPRPPWLGGFIISGELCSCTWCVPCCPSLPRRLCPCPRKRPRYDGCCWPRGPTTAASTASCCVMPSRTRKTSSTCWKRWGPGSGRRAVAAQSRPRCIRERSGRVGAAGAGGRPAGGPAGGAALLLRPRRRRGAASRWGPPGLSASAPRPGDGPCRRAHRRARRLRLRGHNPRQGGQAPSAPFSSTSPST